MNFRLEEKISYKNFNVFEFKKWLISNNAKSLYPSRIINSIYFDKNFKMYDDSIEGTVPRKKIRIRTYNTENFFSSKKNFKKEIKNTFYNYRSKRTDNFYYDKNNFFAGIYDQDYGICKPILNVVYQRSYYKIFNIRLTLDENITYRKINNRRLSNISIKDNDYVVELKTGNVNNIDFLKEMFPIPRTRFSKYCRGVEILYNR
tara:strand:+ start:1236 stop:1844 length:609 start_codon:yes stop_codon:yes gene_type:complete